MLSGSFVDDPLNTKVIDHLSFLLRVCCSSIISQMLELQICQVKYISFSTSFFPVQWVLHSFTLKVSECVIGINVKCFSFCVTAMTIFKKTLDMPKLYCKQVERQIIMVAKSILSRSDQCFDLPDCNYELNKFHSCLSTSGSGTEIH